MEPSVNGTCNVFITKVPAIPLVSVGDSMLKCTKIICLPIAFCSYQVSLMNLMCTIMDL
jgi:hypothetical protein